jgi:very-short-patch-repair endonuclease
MEQELAIKLQDNGIHHLTQVEIPVTTADFYFPTETRPLIVFVDGRVHLTAAQITKDEELRTLLRKRGYRILELCYNSYSDKKRDRLYKAILDNLGYLPVAESSSELEICSALRHRSSYLNRSFSHAATCADRQL